MTFRELQDFVYAQLGVVEPPWQMQVQVKRALVRAHVRIAAERQMRHAVADLAFLAGDPIVALPADFVSIRSIRRDGELMRQVDEVEYARMLTQNESFGFTGPAVFVMQEPDRLEVFPIPETTDSTGAVLEYVQRAPAMSADSDVPVGIPEPWHELVAYTVLAQMGSMEVKNYAVQQVGLMTESLKSHIGGRTGDEYRIQLRGYPRR